MVLNKCASVKKPKLTIHAISTVDDVPVFDPNEAAYRLCPYWGYICRARCGCITSDQAETMLAFVQPTPLDLNWNIGLDEFGELQGRICSWPGWLAVECAPLCRRHWGQVSLRSLPGYSAGIGSPCWLWGKPKGVHSQSLVRLMPKVFSSVRLNLCGLLPHAIVIARLLP